MLMKLFNQLCPPIALLGESVDPGAGNRRQGRFGARKKGGKEKQQKDGANGCQISSEEKFMPISLPFNSALCIKFSRFV